MFLLFKLLCEKDRNPKCLLVSGNTKGMFSVFFQIKFVGTELAVSGNSQL